MPASASALEGPLAVPRFAPAFVTCPMCTADDVEYEFLVDKVALSRCRACTLLFANPAAQRSAAPPADADSNAGYRALKAFVAAYLGSEPHRTLIVDLGGAPVDPDADIRSLESIDPAIRYDLVVAFGVIERDPDPVALLRTLHACVADGGALLAVTPSTHSTAARTMRETWPPLRSKAAWWFSTDTLQLLLSRAGFGRFATAIAPEDIGATGEPALRRFFDTNTAIVAQPVPRSAGARLSVIIPVFNEAATVDELLSRVIAKTIPGVDIEIIVVESNSTDGSREVVQRYAAEPRVRVIFQERPRGKGAAVRAGLACSTGDVVLFQDADLEYDVSDYDQLVAPLFALQRNVVFGSRHGAAGEGWKIRRFEKRRLFSSAMNIAHVGLLAFFNRLYAQSVFDPFTMYKVFRRDCLHGLEFECNRFDFDIEIVSKLYRKGYRPLEIPVNYRSRSFKDGKKVAFLSDPPTWVKAMLRVRREPLYGFAVRREPAR